MTGLLPERDLPAPPPVHAVVLAGGTSRRFGGDKLAAEVGGQADGQSLIELFAEELGALLQRLELLDNATVTFLGPERSLGSGLSAPMSWVPDAETAAGPLHSIAEFVTAQLATAPLIAAESAPAETPSQTAMSHAAPLTLLLSADRPFGPRALPRLLDALSDKNVTDGDVAVGVDDGGRRAYLLALWRTDSLLRHLPASTANTPMRELYASARTHEVPLSAAEQLDVNTQEGLHLVQASLNRDSSAPK